MFSDPAVAGAAAFLVVFAGVTTLGFALTVHVFGDQWLAIHRLRGLARPTPPEPSQPAGAAGWMWGVLPKLGALAVADKKHRVENLRTRLLHAGYFQAQAPLYFVGVQVALGVLLAAVGGLAPFWAGLIPARRILLCALVGCVAGYLAPGFWLSARVRKRQWLLRHALPDALDILVLCLEGGVSLNAAFQWVADELHVVHPALGAEMNIIQREMQLGLSAGDALLKFADRCGLPDVRDLASVLLQSDRYGASVSKALRGYADTARQDRQQRAEEMAQKAAVKILFPTLLCIFPAIFIVVLGPAAFQMMRLFVK